MKKSDFFLNLYEIRINNLQFVRDNKIILPEDVFLVDFHLSGKFREN